MMIIFLPTVKIVVQIAIIVKINHIVLSVREIVLILIVNVLLILFQ